MSLRKLAIFFSRLLHGKITHSEGQAIYSKKEEFLINLSPADASKPAPEKSPKQSAKPEPLEITSSSCWEWLISMGSGYCPVR